jgi:hypothetical protein
MHSSRKTFAPAIKANGVEDALTRHKLVFVPVAPIAEPGAPTNIQATAADGEAIVTFMTPQECGAGVITGYLVRSDAEGLEWQCNCGGVFHAYASSGMIVDRGEVRVSGLTNDLPYMFSVRAINVAGEGEWSAWSNTVLPTPAPVSMSRSFRAVFSSIVGAWNAPAKVDRTLDFGATSAEENFFAPSDAAPLPFDNKDATAVHSAKLEGELNALDSLGELQEEHVAKEHVVETPKSAAKKMSPSRQQDHWSLGSPSFTPPHERITGWRDETPTTRAPEPPNPPPTPPMPKPVIMPGGVWAIPVRSEGTHVTQQPDREHYFGHRFEQAEYSYREEPMFQLINGIRAIIPPSPFAQEKKEDEEKEDENEDDYPSDDEWPYEMKASAENNDKDEGGDDNCNDDDDDGDDQREVDHAATKLQAVARQRNAQREFREKMGEKKDLDEVDQWTSEIQTVLRRRSAQKELEAKREEKQELDQAATKLQGAIRVREAQKELKMKREEKQELDQAATKLQGLAKKRSVEANAKREDAEGQAQKGAKAHVEEVRQADKETEEEAKKEDEKQACKEVDAPAPTLLPPPPPPTSVPAAEATPPPPQPTE